MNDSSVDVAVEMRTLGILKKPKTNFKMSVACLGCMPPAVMSPV
jgi:hypothetical protein